MTDTQKAPTLLGLLGNLSLFTGRDTRYEPSWISAYVELRTALLPFDALSSDLIQKLQDPKLRAAMEVIVEGLPEVMELEAEATPGPWGNDGSDADIYDTHGIAWKSGLVGCVSNQDPRLDHNAKEDCDLIVATRNLIARASQAAQAVEKGKP